MCIKMSDVRLSNASPTLERVDARPPENLRPAVRRNLFGRPDPEEVQRKLADVEEEGVQAFREKYNFDLVNDTPLSGNFVWEQDSNAPGFYLRPPHGSQRPRRGVDLPGDSHQEDAGESSEGRSNRQPASDRSRKRLPGDLGPCSGECPRKRSHTDEDDDEDKSDGAGSQALLAAEERPSRPESSAEVQ